jgi:hypothetical protein
VLAGHRRYAHITALRGDAVAAQAPGMNKVVSEDALRRGLERISEDASAAWMCSALLHSVQEALDKPWVPDVLLTSGKQHSSVHAKSGLGCLLDEIGQRRPGS